MARIHRFANGSGPANLFIANKASDSDREDPHPPGVAGAGTAAGTSPWPAVARCLTPELPPFSQPDAGAAGIDCVRVLREGQSDAEIKVHPYATPMSDTAGRYCRRAVQVAADSKDPIRRCQLPCQGGHGREKGCSNFLSSN